MIKEGDFVVVSSGTVLEEFFSPDVKRKVFLHKPTGQLRIYDDKELNGEVDEEEGWWIDGPALRDFVKEVYDAEPEIELTQVRILGRLYNLVPVEVE